MSIIVVIFLVLAVVPVIPVQASGTCYVWASASGANSGASWANAYTDLQSALGNSPCTEIWVAEGTYKPSVRTNSSYPRSVAFQLKNNVAIYGGFAGTETQRSQRNPAAHSTVLSGDIDNNDSQTPVITDISTVTGNSSNSYHVVYASGIT